jgi:hypothetical protein
MRGLYVQKRPHRFFNGYYFAQYIFQLRYRKNVEIESVVSITNLIITKKKLFTQTTRIVEAFSERLRGLQ